MKKNLFNLFDLLKYLKLNKKRKTKFIEADDSFTELPCNNLLAKSIHPKSQILSIKRIIDETSDTKTFVFEPDKRYTEKLAYFNPGQFITLVIKDNNSIISRSYSISCSPKTTFNQNQYSITIKAFPNCYAPEVIFKTWKVNTKVEAYGPFGDFNINPLRDSKDIIAIASGSGVAPFLSMAKAYIDGLLPYINSFTILYCVNSDQDIIEKQFLDGLESTTKGVIKVVYILATPALTKLPASENGLINAAMIKKYMKNKLSSFFVCGNTFIQNIVMQQLNSMNIEKKYIRSAGANMNEIITAGDEFKQQKLNSEYKIKVLFNNNARTIRARSNEPLIVALERNGILINNGCRTGKCGACVARLVSGSVYIPSEFDFRKIADKKYNFIYTCACYPASDDLTIEFTAKKPTL